MKKLTLYISLAVTALLGSTYADALAWDQVTADTNGVAISGVTYEVCHELGVTVMEGINIYTVYEQPTIISCSTNYCDLSGLQRGQYRISVRALLDSQYSAWSDYLIAVINVPPPGEYEPVNFTANFYDDGWYNAYLSTNLLDGTWTHIGRAKRGLSYTTDLPVAFFKIEVE